MMKLDKNSYKKYFEGFFVADCIVRKKDIVYFVVEQVRNEAILNSSAGKMRTRVIACIDRPNVAQWSQSDLGGMHRLVAGVSLRPKEQFVGVSLNDHVYVLGGGDGGFEKDLKGSDSKELREAKAAPQEYLTRGGIQKLRTIDGVLYGCGRGRTVINRQGKDDWHYHTALPKDKHVSDPTGFFDIDGFSSVDIYAAGGHGDVWHYDGKKWKQLAFPSNMTLETICCAGDGHVYIGADSGTVYRGRGAHWERIFRGDSTLSYRDMVWHDGKVWATNDHGVWVIDDGKVKRASLPDGVRICAGHLSVGDGVMLLAGVYGAAIHDGKDWHMVIDYNDLS